MMSLNERISLERSKFMLYPDSYKRGVWDILSFLLILYQSIMLPFIMTFEPDMPNDIVYFDFIQDVFFLADIALNFQTGLFEKGILVMWWDRVAINYLTTWFFPDVIACFPYTWVLAINAGVSPFDLENVTIIDQ